MNCSPRWFMNDRFSIEDSGGTVVGSGELTAVRSGGEVEMCVWDAQTEIDTPTSRYVLFIESQEVGTFTNEDLDSTGTVELTCKATRGPGVVPRDEVDEEVGSCAVGA